MQDRLQMISFAAMFRGKLLGKRKRQGKLGRRTMKKTDGREEEEQKKHDDERSTMNKDKDK